MRCIALTTLLILSLSASATDLDFAQIEKDIRLIEVHYKPGMDEKTLKSIDVLARSTAAKLIGLINNPENDEDLHERSQSAWNKLELALGSVENDTETLIANEQLHREIMLREQIDLRVSIIQNLYNQESKSSAKLGGTIIYRFTFSESGYIRDIEIKDVPSNMEKLANSISPSLLTLRISARDTPIQVDYPLNFFPHRYSSTTKVGHTNQTGSANINAIGMDKDALPHISEVFSGTAQAWRELQESGKITTNAEEEILYIVAKKEALKGNHEASIKALSQLNRKHPQGQFQFEVNFRLAEEAFKNGELAIAFKHYEKSLGGDKDMADQARYKMAFTKLQMNELDEALRYFTSTLDSNSNTSKYLYSIKDDSLRGVGLIALCLCQNSEANAKTLEQIKTAKKYRGVREKIQAVLGEEGFSVDISLQTCALEGWRSQPQTN